MLFRSCPQVAAAKYLELPPEKNWLENNRVEALSVADGKVLSVGTTADLKKTAGPRTRVIDLGGRTVVPLRRVKRCFH